MDRSIEIEFENLKSEVKEIKAWVKALYVFIVPEKKDYSELSAIAQKLVKQGKPPRKQPKKCKVCNINLTKRNGNSDFCKLHEPYAITN